MRLVAKAAVRHIVTSPDVPVPIFVGFPLLLVCKRYVSGRAAWKSTLACLEVGEDVLSPTTSIGANVHGSIATGTLEVLQDFGRGAAESCGQADSFGLQTRRNCREGTCLTRRHCLKRLARDMMKSGGFDASFSSSVSFAIVVRL
jgi:hypothetical protein